MLTNAVGGMYFKQKDLIINFLSNVTNYMCICKNETAVVCGYLKKKTATHKS